MKCFQGFISCEVLTSDLGQVYAYANRAYAPEVRSRPKTLGPSREEAVGIFEAVNVRHKSADGGNGRQSSKGTLSIQVYQEEQVYTFCQRTFTKRV